jgi:hypothetical protein
MEGIRNPREFVKQAKLLMVWAEKIGQAMSEHDEEELHAHKYTREGSDYG